MATTKQKHPIDIETDSQSVYSIDGSTLYAVNPEKESEGAIQQCAKRDTDAFKHASVLKEVVESDAISTDKTQMKRLTEKANKKKKGGKKKPATDKSITLAKNRRVTIGSSIGTKVAAVIEEAVASSTKQENTASNTIFFTVVESNPAQEKPAGISKKNDHKKLKHTHEEADHEESEEGSESESEHEELLPEEFENEIEEKQENEAADSEMDSSHHQERKKYVAEEKPAKSKEENQFARLLIQQPYTLFSANKNHAKKEENFQAEKLSGDFYKLDPERLDLTIAFSV